MGALPRGGYMFEGMDISQILVLVTPLIALQLGLQVFCLIKIFKQGTENLNKIAWAIIVVLVNLFGPLAFLLFGRKKGI
jgi:hypothetical protein